MPYDRWLGAPERAILRLLGFFDRPAPGGALAELRAEPAVAGLNKGLVGLGDPEWKRLIGRLRKAGLVEGTESETVDAHPLVRAYFGEVLKEENEAAWVEGSRRLYAWYSGAAKERPDTAAEMEPLYAAVMHGCRAGRYQESYDDVFRKRIRRFGEAYSIRKLGTFGADLSALAGFFEEPWIRPVKALREVSRSVVLNDAGFALRALGRLPEAVAPMRAGLEMDVSVKDWKNAAAQASNLSELHLALGQLPEAIKTARQSVELADRSGGAFLRMSNRTTLADALHQAGQPDEAARLFREAEGMQKEDQPAFPLLSSLQGYQYCDLLLLRNEAAAVLRRAEQTLVWEKQHLGLLDIALDQLIHRAAFHRQLHELDAAAGDLDEALRFATRGQMRLHESDARLERIRLLHALHKPTEARTELDKARALITQMGYLCRTPELDELASLIGQ